MAETIKGRRGRLRTERREKRKGKIGITLNEMPMKLGRGASRESMEGSPPLRKRIHCKGGVKKRALYRISIIFRFPSPRIEDCKESGTTTSGNWSYDGNSMLSTTRNPLEKEAKGVGPPQRLGVDVEGS